MLSARVAQRETLTKSLDDLAEDDPSREAIQTELKELEIVLRNIKDEQRATRKGEKEGHSSRQERDKSDMGGRLAYITLKEEMAATPLSRHARNTLLQEDPYAEPPEVRARTRDLPPSEKRVTEAKKKKKHRKERKREQRKKAEKVGRARGRTGHLTVFGGSPSAPKVQDGWTRVDFVVDSGASATTLPRKVVGESTKLERPVGYSSFRLADGNVVENEGTLRAKAWLMGDETLEIRASVAAIAQPLLSVGQVTSRGNRVILGPKVSYLETNTGKKHRIFLKNGVYVLPVWMDTANNLFELSSHPFAGRGDARL